MWKMTWKPMPLQRYILSVSSQTAGAPPTSEINTLAAKQVWQLAGGDVQTGQ